MSNQSAHFCSPTQGLGRMPNAWQFREERNRLHSGRGSRPLFPASRPQLEMLEDRLAPSNNVLPSIHFPARDLLAQGEILHASGAISDPQASSLTAQVDYGDGTGPVSFPLQAGQPLILNHHYAQDGNYDVSVIVKDNLGEEAHASLKVHAQALPEGPTNTANPIFPPAPITPAGLILPSQGINWPASANGRFIPSNPGYLVVPAEEQISTSFKIAAADISWAPEFLSEIQTASWISPTNQAGLDTDAILLEKLKIRATRQAAGPAVKYTSDVKPDLEYEPKISPLQEIGPRSTKKNVQLLFYLQPDSFDCAQLTIQLLEQRKPANAFLAVLVLFWGMKRRKRPNVRWERNPNWPRKKRRPEIDKAWPGKASRAAARAPPRVGYNSI